MCGEYRSMIYLSVEYFKFMIVMGSFEHRFSNFKIGYQIRLKVNAEKTKYMLISKEKRFGNFLVSTAAFKRRSSNAWDRL